MNMKKRMTYLTPGVTMVRMQIKTSLLNASPGGTSVTPDSGEGYDAWDGMAKKHYSAWDTWEDENEDNKQNNTNFQ